jgi:tetratricopeptide (TPR) repeat protein
MNRHLPKKGPWFRARWFRSAANGFETEQDHDATEAYFEHRIADAERLFIAAVKRAETFGPHSARLATALNNLAELYRVQGEFAQAEPHYWRALTIDEQVLGPDHLDLARDLHNLALLYRAQGRYADAEPLCRRALEIRQKGLPPEHPGTAATLSNLLAIYLAQGKYAQAEPLYRRVLAIKAQRLGPDHPDFASSLDIYAALLRRTRGESEAVRFTGRAALVGHRAVGR